MLFKASVVIILYWHGNYFFRTCLRKRGDLHNVVSALKYLPMPPGGLDSRMESLAFRLDGDVCRNIWCCRRAFVRTQGRHGQMPQGVARELDRRTIALITAAESWLSTLWIHSIQMSLQSYTYLWLLMCILRYSDLVKEYDENLLYVGLEIGLTQSKLKQSSTKIMFFFNLLQTADKNIHK